MYNEKGKDGIYTDHESETDVVWACEEMRPILFRETNNGDGTAWKPKKVKQRWMDCANRDMGAIGMTEDGVHDRIGWRRFVSAAATSCNGDRAVRRRRRWRRKKKKK